MVPGSRARELQDHVYVDDIAWSRATSAKVKQITNEIDAILEKANFQLKVWHSNQVEIDQSNGESSTDLLGLRWDKQTDKFPLKKNELGLLEDLTIMVPCWSCGACNNQVQNRLTRIVEFRLQMR